MKYGAGVRKVREAILYSRAFERLNSLTDPEPALRLLRALLIERQARFTTLGKEEDAAAARVQSELREFAEGGDV